jgi:hypothetical protein
VKLIVQGLERAAVVRFIEGDFLATEIALVEESRGQSEEAFSLSGAVFQGLPILRQRPSLFPAPSHRPLYQRTLR